MIGWRWWMVDGDTLVSPFADVPLPDDGTATGGVSFYASQTDIATVMKYLDPTTTAITRGTITGTHTRDTQPQLYKIGHQWVKLPEARVGDTYTVTHVVTDATGLRYAVPVHPWTTTQDDPK